jgi:Ca2+-binding RTX toxin-like protein
MTVTLNNSPNLYVGTALNDVVYGLGGNDALFGEKGSDWLYGDDGNDLLSGGDGVDLLFGGTDSGDPLLSTGNYDTAYYALYTGGVTASLASGFGYKTSLGKAADADFYFSIENLTGSNYGDKLDGDGGSNTLRGLDGDDVLRGLNNFDTLDGGAGKDTLEGGEGYDNLTGGAGGDVLNGGNGDDTVTYTYSSAGVYLNLTTGVGSGGDATGDTLISIEGVMGSKFADTIGGNSGANYINCGDGDDVANGAGGQDSLQGGFGSDTLTGGAGDDTLAGGDGIDYLTGSQGDDRFAFTTYDSDGDSPDQIMDFTHFVDEIDLLEIDAKQSTAAGDAFTFIGTAAFTPGVEGQLRYEKVGANTMIYGNTDGTGSLDIAIMLVNYSGALTAADFIL